MGSSGGNSNDRASGGRGESRSSSRQSLLGKFKNMSSNRRGRWAR